MSDESPTATSPAGTGGAGSRHWTGRLWRLMLKELRETLRDRRTIITLVVMPTLIYPLLALAFQRFLVTSVSVSQDVEYHIGVGPEWAGRILVEQLQAGEGQLESARRASEKALRSGGSAQPEAHIARHADRREPIDPPPPKLMFYPLPPDELAGRVADSTLHLAALARHNLDDEPERGLDAPRTWELFYRGGSPTSEAALHYVEERLSAFNTKQLDAQLQKLGVTAVSEAPTVRHPIEFAGAPVFSLAALIPLVLVLMTVTGAVYPAIDLTAGERERGTLEMLIAAPVPRLGLLLAKYAAVLTVALLTAVVNLAAMTITVRSTGLEATLFGEAGMSLALVLKVLLLLALFAAFFSAMLLALTSYARSFKEAQAYIIPLMLLCLVPGVLCLLPSLEFRAWMSVTPLVNMLMLARDMLEGQVDFGLAVAAVLSTAFYVAAAIALAARIFGTDAILYGSQATWSDIFRRPAQPQSVASVPSAMLCLALMFPAYFVLANSLVHADTNSLALRLVAAGGITAFVFAVIPLAVAIFGRVRAACGMGLRLDPPGRAAAQCLAAALLGFALWPFAHEIYLASVGMGLSSLGQDQVGRALRLLDELRGLPLPLVLVTLAVVPAVFEEFFFRGLLFASLRAVLAAWQTILATAILFGVFHEVLGPGRLLASMSLGLVLGWVRLRTGSVWPCMVLHLVHNGLLLSISYWRPALEAHGWGLAEQAHLPSSWLMAAGVGVAVAIVILMTSTRGGAPAVSR